MKKEILLHQWKRKDKINLYKHYEKKGKVTLRLIIIIKEIFLLHKLI